jgi:carbamoyl-phosphate synthase large subunit
MRGAAVDAKKVVILGGGPNRIGQGIEFDYCCVPRRLRAARARLRDHHGQLQPRDRLDGLRHLDRLYFEPLTLEDVLNIVRSSRSSGTRRA